MPRLHTATTGSSSLELFKKQFGDDAKYKIVNKKDYEGNPYEFYRVVQPKVYKYCKTLEEFEKRYPGQPMQARRVSDIDGVRQYIFYPRKPASRRRSQISQHEPLDSKIDHGD